MNKPENPVQQVSYDQKVFKFITKYNELIDRHLPFKLH